MDLFPTLRIIRQPHNDEARQQLDRAGGSGNLLVLYDGDLPFLERVLLAAGYSAPREDCYLLQRDTDAAPLSLTDLSTHLGVSRVILFGQKLPDLGLHFQVAKYVLVVVGATTYMICDSVADISAAKDAGDNKPSRALWGGIQAAFTNPAKETT